MMMSLDGADIDTPRGDTAKAEVKRLRAMLIERGHKTTQLLARIRFNELDTDKSGFLENAELVSCAKWVMETFGDKLGHDPEKIMKKMMQRLDANRDGKLDPEEFEILFEKVVQRHSIMERAQAKFKQFDTDNSGFLENKEIDEVVTWTLHAFPEGDDYVTYKDKLMKEIDANGDGKLDMNEFTALFEDFLVRLELVQRSKQRFDELDTDKSGMLEKQELDKVTEWVLQAYVEKSEEERTQFKATLMKRIDVNQDGKLSRQEFAVVFDEIMLRMDLLKRARVQFDKLDADKSGFLEKNELGPILKVWAEACNVEINVDPAAALDAMLNSLDANNDGKLEIAEFIVLFEKVINEVGIWAMPDPAPAA